MTEPGALRHVCLAAIERAGLHVRRSSFWNAAMYLPTAALRLGKRLVQGPASPEIKPGATGDLYHFPGPANRLLLAWVKAENRLLRHVDLPLGVSVFALAEKPSP